MKILGKLWWVIDLIGMCLSFIIPYIGIFAMFNCITFFISAILNFLIYKGQKIEKSQDIGIVRSSKYFLKYLSYILSVLFFCIKVVVGSAAYILGSMQGRIALPFNLMADNMDMCFTLFIVTIFVYVLVMVAYIINIKNLTKE